MAFSDTARTALGAATAGLGVGLGSILGAITRRKNNREIEKFNRFSNAWHDQHINELGVERANAQESLSALRAAQAQRMSAARGANAVMGASAGSAAAEKNAANMAMGQTIGQINANAEAYTRGYEDSLYNSQKEMAAQRIANNNNTINQLGASTGVISGLGADIIRSGMYDPVTGNKKDGTTSTT